jgi:hypothetical protein
VQLAAEQQLARRALAEDLGQQQRPRVGGHQPDADLGRGEACPARCDAQVAARGELERAADADAVDGGEHGHRGRQRHASQPLERGDSGRPRRGVGRQRGVQVVAGREVLARAARDDAAHGRVGACLGDCVGDRIDGLAGPRVAPGAAVPAHDARGPQALHGDGHGVLPPASTIESGSSSPRAVR